MTSVFENMYCVHLKILQLNTSKWIKNDHKTNLGKGIQM